MEILDFIDKNQTTCSAQIECPAGYPEHLFAPNISEGYRLIESGQQKFVFIPQQANGSKTFRTPPLSKIPHTAGQFLTVRLSVDLDLSDSNIKPLTSLLKGFTFVSGSNSYDIPADGLSSYLPGYPKELFYLPDSDFSTYASVDPEKLQARINNAVNQTGSRGQAFDRLAFEFDALAGDAFRRAESNYRFLSIMSGADTLHPTPYWHIDPESILKAPFGINLVNLWQGIGTVYCDTGSNVPRGDVIENAKELSKYFSEIYQDIKSVSLNFSHPVLWDYVKGTIGYSFKVNNVSIYYYVATQSSPQLRQALQDYENYVYYNISKLELTFNDQVNDKIVDYFKTSSRLNEICTLMGGNVYVTPPGYMSMHAMSDDYRVAALHRSPSPGFEKTEARFGVAVFRSPKEALSHNETGSAAATDEEKVVN